MPPIVGHFSAWSTPITSHIFYKLRPGNWQDIQVNFVFHFFRASLQIYFVTFLNSNWVCFFLFTSTREPVADLPPVHAGSTSGHLQVRHVLQAPRVPAFHHEVPPPGRLQVHHHHRPRPQLRLQRQLLQQQRQERPRLPEERAWSRQGCQFPGRS